MKGFIKVSNDIFSYELSPKALKLYVYLSGRGNCLQSITITTVKLSAACYMDSKTIRSTVKELERKGLVAKQNRFNSRGYLANRYYVKNIIKNKGWFKVEREVFTTPIKPVDFTIFCYAKMCMNQKGEAFPSLTKIAEGTGISRSRVAKAVVAYRHNRYIAFKCNMVKGKVRPLCTEKRTSIKMKKFKKLTTYMIIPFKHKVNSHYNEIWNYNSHFTSDKLCEWISPG